VLLGDKAVISIAQQYSITIFKLGEIAKSSPIDEGRWLGAVQEMSRARWYFHNAIRNDLEIKSGDLEPDAMPSWMPIGLESSFNQSSDSVN
jgi:hypothetical protein